jgi:hypothetical protein
MAYENGAEPDKDIAARTGEFAMLIFSIGTPLITDLVYFKITNMIILDSRCVRWFLTPSSGST